MNSRHLREARDDIAPGNFSAVEFYNQKYFFVISDYYFANGVSAGGREARWRAANVHDARQACKFLKQHNWRTINAWYAKLSKIASDTQLLTVTHGEILA